MAKTLKDLGLALINATLILLALCLFLALTVVNRIDGLTETFSQNLITVQPLREEVQATREELAALRADLAEVISQGGDFSSAAALRMQAKLDGMEAKMDETRARMSDLADAPARLVDHAIEKTGQELGDTVIRLRGCVPEGDLPQAVSG